MEVQELLPTFTPTESELVERAMGVSLDKKVVKSIGLLRMMEPRALRLHCGGIIAGNSGGKDSIAVKRLLQLAGVSFMDVYNNTTIDPPPLVRYLKDHHKDTVWHNSGRGHLILNRMVEKMSIPTRLGRWCCSEYKDCCSCEKSIGAVGVRVEESAKRAALWKEVVVHNKTDRTILAPIVYWTEKDVWDFIHGENLPYCELYDQGWSRLGCVGCPLNQVSQKKEFERWPKYEAMWKEGIRRVWEKAQIVTKKNGEPYAVAKYESPEAVWDWWLNQQEEHDDNCVFEEMMEGLK